MAETVGVIFDEESARILQRLVSAVLGMTGPPGTRVGLDGIVIGQAIAQAAGSRGRPAQAIILAKITGNASRGTNMWKYAWEEVRLNGTAWETFDGGRTGSTSANWAQYGGEDAHTATSAWGAEVLETDEATLTPGAIPNGTPFAGLIVPNLAGGWNLLILGGLGTLGLVCEEPAE